MKKWIRDIIFILIFAIIILFVKFVCYPAYISEVASCSPEKFTKDYGNKYELTGSFSVNEMNNNVTTNICVVNKNDVLVVRHEQCHLNQYEHKRLYSCDKKFLVWINEVECYSVERYYDIFF